MSRKDRIASRFLGQLHAAFANASVEAKKDRGLTQKQIAEELKIDKAAVSRILKGIGNPTARTIGELAAAMGYRPELVLHKIETSNGSNYASVKSDGNKVTVSVSNPPSTEGNVTAVYNSNLSKTAA
jgi:ribosome-binding protein aMBF1 (putative translation factor)